MTLTNVWRQIYQAIIDDFSDVPDIGHVTQIVVRLLVAAVLGGLLGFERERAGKSAGLRTHMLVALGSALFILIPQQAGASPDGLTRILQGLVAGIGFLGTGSILKSRDDDQIHGLTTAASIWLTAAVGVAAGMGREASATLSAALALLILAAPRHIERRLGGQTSDHEKLTPQRPRPDDPQDE